MIIFGGKIAMEETHMHRPRRYTDPGYNTHMIVKRGNEGKIRRNVDFLATYGTIFLYLLYAFYVFSMLS